VRRNASFCGPLIARKADRDEAGWRDAEQDRIVGVGSDVGPHFVCAAPTSPNPLQVAARAPKPAGGQRIAARSPAATADIRSPDFFARL